MIELGGGAAVRARDPCRKQPDTESQLAQQTRKSAVQLVTEAAAAQFDDLVKEAFLITQNFATERDVEIFEGNGIQVSDVKASKRFRSRMGISGEADAGEVGGRIHPNYWMLSRFSRLCFAHKI